MKSTSISSFLFILFLCFIFYASLPALCLFVGVYVKVCAEYTPLTEFKHCLKLLQTDPRIPSVATYPELSFYILEMSINEAMSTQASFIEMAQRFPTEEALSQCANEFYDTTITSFNNALDMLHKDALSSRNDVQDATRGVIGCIKALQNTNETFDPAVYARNNDTFLLSVVSFYAINHILT